MNAISFYKVIFEHYGKTVPHIVQYQGSKRILAPKILEYFPHRFARLIEPFSGMAAITMAVAQQHRAQKYYLNDLNTPLVEILREAVETPDILIAEYEKYGKSNCRLMKVVLHIFIKLEKSLIKEIKRLLICYIYWPDA